MLQQQTVRSLQAAIRPRLQALKNLPQATAHPTQTTVAISFGDAGTPLKLSAAGVESSQRSEEEGDIYEYLESSVADYPTITNDRESRTQEADVREEIHDREDGAPLDVLVSVNEDGLSATWKNDEAELDDVTDAQAKDQRASKTNTAEKDTKGKVMSLDDWIYSDETEGQKRMREGLAVLDRYVQ